MTALPGRDDLPATIAAVVRRAEERGARLAEVAQWSQALVAHMAGPIAAADFEALAAEFPTLERFENAGTPHNAADRGLIDRQVASAISFPLG